MVPTLKEIEALTLEAGEILCNYFGHELEIAFKGEIDLVTEADLQAEKYLLGEIRRRFPDDVVVSEESGSLDGNLCCKWYVDPLDGTINFSHGLPIFSVSVGYVKNGEVYAGAVYDPTRSELFSAQLGHGARCNGKPIHVSDQRELIRSLLVTGFAYDIRTNPVNNLNWFEKFSKRSQGVRRLGSAALDLCYVACGRFDGFWEIAIQPWDIAAGGLIAREAGARVTQTNGDANYLAIPCSILAANALLHTEMLGVIQQQA